MKAPSFPVFFRQIKKKILTLTPLEIFIILTVASLTIFMVKFFGGKNEWRTIRVEVVGKDWTITAFYGPKTPFWLSDKLKVGQTEKNMAGQEIAKLINIENYERGGEEAESYLTVQVKGNLNKRTGRYSFKDKPLSVGLPIELNLDNVNVVGQVVDDNVPSNGYPTKTFKLKMVAYALQPWTISQIAAKPKVYNRGSDQTVAEITDVQVKDETYKSMWIDGGLLKLNQNYSQDVFITANITAQQIDKRWYYGGHQELKVGNNLYLNTDKINMVFIIQEINESAN